MEARERIILPLDVDSFETGKKLVQELAPYVGAFKVGYEFGYNFGWKESAEMVQAAGGHVFFDVKLNDIPNTVAGGVKALASLNPWLINVHASAGIEALKAAVANKGEAKLFAVTVLTSISNDVSEHVFGKPAQEKVVEFAFDALEAGCDGIVCSAQELSLLAEHPELQKLEKITPGIRPVWADANDQKRMLTPVAAVAAGADYLVIGRPITKPSVEVGTSVDAVKKVIEELNNG